ncbi:hypothetical protein MMC12_000237 [Toensbergia leucococca]|nr:hypothetical protein [Toensbergia leucococca]
MPTPEFNHFHTLMKHLTCLNFVFRIDVSLEPDEIVDRDMDDSRIERKLSTAMSAAHNLQVLSLNITSDMCCNRSEGFPQLPFQAILGACKFPKPKSLSLNGFNSTNKEIASFLEDSRGIQHLTIENHLLHDGFWEVVAEQLRNLLALKSVIVFSLESVCDSDDQIYTMKISLIKVENFFFRNGPNTLTQKVTGTELAQSPVDLEFERLYLAASVAVVLSSSKFILESAC